MAQGLYLSQKMSQTMVLAPQLQQSLALLQAPILELRAQVEAELEQNPVLEEAATGEMEPVEKGAKEKKEVAEQIDPTEPPADVTFDPATEKESSEPVDDFQAEFEKLTQLDQEWRDVFSQANVPNRASEEDEERRQFMFDSLVAGQSLQENLLEQLRDTDIAPELMPLGEMLVGNIDERGWLAASLEEMSASTGVAAEKFATALTIVQTADDIRLSSSSVSTRSEFHSNEWSETRISAMSRHTCPSCAIPSSARN